MSADDADRALCAPAPGETGDAAAERPGFAAGVAAAVAVAGPLLPMREAEQMELLRGDDGEIRSDQAKSVQRGRGRPAGASNKRTADVRDYLLSRYAHPLEVLAQMISRPIDAIVAELGCKPIEAALLVKSAAAELAPYVEGKMPISIDITKRADVVLVMTAPEAAEAVRDAVQEVGVDAIDWARATVGGVVSETAEFREILDGEEAQSK